MSFAIIRLLQLAVLLFALALAAAFGMEIEEHKRAPNATVASLQLFVGTILSVLILMLLEFALR